MAVKQKSGIAVGLNSGHVRPPLHTIPPQTSAMHQDLQVFSPTKITK